MIFVIKTWNILFLGLFIEASMKIAAVIQLVFWLNGSGPISDFLFNKEPWRRLDVMRQNFSWHFHITVLLFSWVFTDMEAILFYSLQKFHLLEHVLQLKFAVSLSPAVRIRQGKLIILKFQLGYMAEYFTISTVVWIFVSPAPCMCTSISNVC